MRRKIKGFITGLFALSLAAAAPLTAVAGQADLGDSMVLISEVQAKKTDTGKTDTKKPAKVESQKVGKVTCTSAGKINISFKNKVTYTDALKVTIIDAQGQETDCKVSKKNKNLLTVAASGLVAGQTYTVTIEGILGKDTNEAVTITKSFVAKGMKTKCKAAKASVKDKKFVVIKMNGSVYYKDATVIVTDADGKVYGAKIVKKAKGNIKVKIEGMQKKKTYTITINGVKTKSEKNYGSITKTITVK